MVNMNTEQRLLVSLSIPAAVMLPPGARLRLGTVLKGEWYVNIETERMEQAPVDLAGLAVVSLSGKSALYFPGVQALLRLIARVFNVGDSAITTGSYSGKLVMARTTALHLLQLAYPEVLWFSVFSVTQETLRRTQARHVTNMQTYAAYRALFEQVWNELQKSTTDLNRLWLTIDRNKNKHETNQTTVKGCQTAG